MSVTYQQAGVDIDAGHQVVDRIKPHVQKTHAPAVLNALGGFGALYDLKDIIQDYKNPVMVQSIDGLGTKTMVAHKAHQWGGLGEDLLSATSNDILVLGAKSLTLLDYVASSKLDPTIIEAIVKSMAEACVAQQVSLVGGETAEMPQTYQHGEYDVVGIITGVVDKENIIDGSGITSGDYLIGLPSSGLHTNGYSLARHILFDQANLSISDTPSLLQGQSIQQALLRPHINYAKPVHGVLDRGGSILGMAHITGGGLKDNIPRMLPKGLGAKIKINSWPKLPIFELLVQLGGLDQKEAYRALNMGIGYVLAVRPHDWPSIKHALDQLSQVYYHIGEVVQGQGVVLC